MKAILHSLCRFPHTRVWGLSLALTVAGCGGSGPRANDNSGQNQNQNQNQNANQNGNLNANQNANGDGGLAVSIFASDSGPFEVGASAQFIATVEDAVGSTTFAWSVDDVTVASLAGNSTQSVTVSFLADGTVELMVQATDAATGEIDTDSIELTVSDDPTPPVGASVRVFDMCTQPGAPVGLVAEITGPAPQAVDWDLDATNPIQPFDFTDLGNGIASFTAPVDLLFIYNLNFVFTATYSNGSSLTEVATVTVMGNGAACF